MSNILPDRRSNSLLVFDIGCCSSSWSSPVSRNAQMRKQDNASKMALDFTSGKRNCLENNYFDIEFRLAPLEKSYKTPIKSPIDRELLKDKETKRSSPSLVARLMGLDTLPPHATKHQKQRGNTSQDTSFVDSEDCKDVFEVMEIPKSEKRKNKPFCRGTPHSEHSEIDLRSCEIDLGFAKQKFIDENNLSFNDEFDDISELSDFNEDLFMKFLEEPRVFKKHASHITILKPSSELRSGAERNNVRPSQSLHGDISSLRKHVSNVVSHHLNEHSYSAPIVLLKPSHDKAHDMMQTVPLAKFLDKYQYELRRQEGINAPKRCAVYSGEREMLKLHDNLVVTGHHSKRIREIARQVTERLKNATMKSYGYVRDESSRESSESFQWTNDNDSLSSSSYYSAESLVSKEARKRLSDRYKMIQQMQKRSIDKAYGTLEEILVSDRERPRTTLNKSYNEHNLIEKMTRDLYRSKSVPTSASSYRNLKHPKRNMVHNMLNKNRDDSLDIDVSRRSSSVPNLNLDMNTTQVYCCKEDSDKCDGEIHVNPEGLDSRKLGEEVSNMLPQCKDSEFAIIGGDQQMQYGTIFLSQMKTGEVSTADPYYLARKEHETLDNEPQIHSELPSLVKPKEEEISPISVLDLSPSKEDNSSSECFEKLSADIKELRMQLKLLKSESPETDAEELDLIYSDEDIREELIEAFNDDEDRDYSYLLDMLIYSGIHSTTATEITKPSRREVFEKLEKKYYVLEAWSISERMLLFDHISDVLSDIMKYKRCCTNWARENLVEEMWQIVARQRKEMSGILEEKLLLDPRWLDLGDDADLVAVELENMITDELMEEFIYRWICV